MAKGIKRKINHVVDAVSKEIAGQTDQNNMYSRGLSGEGYRGGYRQALWDVLQALNGDVPSGRFARYWRECEKD